MSIFEFDEGTTPLLVSMPHDGTAIPEDLSRRMTAEARMVPDTDWHVSRLYDFAADLGASVIRATYSRYVVDLNRPPDGEPLYPGASNTELCPTLCFDMSPIYIEGDEPSESEIAGRRQRYWQPYHDQLSETLDLLRNRHGVALLYEAHSIRSEVPRFFDGKLPDLNLGTAGSESCEWSLEASLAGVLKRASTYTHAVNGRFTGGYITRHYGDPAKGVHAVQLEQAQCTYMEETHPFAYREDLAEGVRPVLRELLQTMLEWAARRSA